MSQTKTSGRRSASRRALAAMAFGAALAASTPAAAKPPATKPPAAKPPSPACVYAYEDAQDARRFGRAGEERASLLECARPGCDALGPLCGAELAKLEAILALVAPVVTDAAGAPIVDVEVRMDGEHLTSRLDGRPIAIEPGVHEFSFRPSGKPAFTRKIMVVQGQRGALPVSLPSAGAPSGPRPDGLDAEDTPPAAPPRAERGALAVRASRAGTPADAGTRAGRGGAPLSAWLLAGLGLTGLGGYGLLTYWGHSDNQQLAGCSPNCSASSVDHIRTLYVAADVSLGVGVVALGVATWLFARGGSSDEGPTRAAYSLDVTPLRSGAYATLSRAF